MEHQVDLASHPFLRSQIIAYIGNKRRLLPLIGEAINRCPIDKTKAVFVDLFAGSGVVSRLAKYLRFKVISNDWEDYSYIINSAYIGIDRNELPHLFPDFGGLGGILDYLNSLPEPGAGERYIADHYTPEDHDVEKADFRRERLFYTRENGLIIDKIRNEIDRLYPEEGEGRKAKEKNLLIALLLYEAATHTNTSGVFKAYHKGFGGHGKDALGRILGTISLKGPVLIDSSHHCSVFKRDANELILSSHLDWGEESITYIDPPYNQHQYGSNYHLLNTIARWDKPDIDNGRNGAGELLVKAAIRKDWVSTKSSYCYKGQASEAFSSLIKHIPSRYLLISYSTEGIIPFEEMKKMCTERGMVDIVTNEYTKYRGGKQSVSRLNSNIEFVLIVDTARRHSIVQEEELRALLERKKLAIMFDKKYRFRLLEREFTLDVTHKTVTATIDGHAITLSSQHFISLSSPQELEQLSFQACRELRVKLEKCVCRNKEEELQELLFLIESVMQHVRDVQLSLIPESSSPELPAAAVYAVKQIPQILKKIAHKKYRSRFEFRLARIRDLGCRYPELYSHIEAKIAKVEESAMMRFSN